MFPKKKIYGAPHGSCGGCPPRFPSRIFGYRSNRTEDKNLLRFAQTEAHPYWQCLTVFVIRKRLHLCFKPQHTLILRDNEKFRTHLTCSIFFINISRTQNHIVSDIVVAVCVSWILLWLASHKSSLCLLWIDERKLLKPIYECRCNGRLQTKRFTRLAPTGSKVLVYYYESMKRKLI